MTAYNDAHRRSFSATIQVVEDKLQEMENLLCFKGKRQGDIQLITQNDLSTEEAQILRQQIAQMREMLARFASEYGIGKEQRSVRRMLSIKAAFLWEELSGATFDRLEGYGKVEVAERNRYELHIEEMTQLAEKIMMYTK